MGGASGGVALRRAARAVQSGDAEIVACVGADTNHVDTFRNTIATFSQFANDAVYPYGSGGPNSSFAFLTDYYMREFGAEREDFGKLCIAQRENALPIKHAMIAWWGPVLMEYYAGTEGNGLSYATQASQFIFHPQVGEVGQIQRIVGFVG